MTLIVAESKNISAAMQAVKTRRKLNGEFRHHKKWSN